MKVYVLGTAERPGVVAEVARRHGADEVVKVKSLTTDELELNERLARQGIAAVETEARRRGLAGVRLGVRVVLTENQRLFAALGYIETSREPHPGFDYPTSINMRKALE